MRLFRDIKKYWRYIWYSARADLKNEVAGSYLNRLWWILDPILFMLVYAFIAQVVFDAKKIDYFFAFVFLGLTVWNFFNKVINTSVRIIKKNKGIISKIYIPKHIILLSNVGVNLFKMVISLAIVVILCILYGVPLSVYMLWAIPIIALLILMSFGIAAIFLHLGVFVYDMTNIVTVGLRLVFYLSGVFYSVSGRLGDQKFCNIPLSNLLLAINPIAGIIENFRNTFLYGAPPNYMFMIVWTAISIVLASLGVRLIYRYENSYAKVI